MKSPSEIPWGQREKMERRKSVKWNYINSGL